MEYRRLGKAGIKVSALSLGSWVTYGEQVGEKIAQECMQAAYEGGVNFFDTAEGYADGKAENIVGHVLKKMGWQRKDLVISTKIYWGGRGPNDRSLSYKHIVEGVNNSLKRLQLEYVDLIYCHRPDPETPIEETVWAMNHVIQQGKAFYWGTSEWRAADIMRAVGIARQYNLRPPSMEQPQYNMLHRYRFEVEYAPLFKELGYGMTTYSPLYFGILTGKYNQGIPEGSRASLEGYGWLKDTLYEEGVIEKVKKLQPVASELGISMAQLAIAWLLKNPNVSSVITGASKVEHVHDNLKALDAVPKLTDEVMASIEEILENKPVVEED
jgi:voltage-dependent potassium channel beta subunit